MDSLPLCNLLQDGWGALCTWNKGSDQNQAIVLHCRQGGATRAPLLLQGPFPSSSIPQLREERIPSNQHSNVVHPAQNQCGTQGQEFKVHLQKVNRLITEEKIYLVKYWQADRGKRSWTVKLATLILHPLERLLRGPLHWAALSWKSHPQYGSCNSMTQERVPFWSLAA